MNIFIEDLDQVALNSALKTDIKIPPKTNMHVIEYHTILLLKHPHLFRTTLFYI